MCDELIDGQKEAAISTDRDAARETLQAMFWATVVAEAAGEPDISTSRLAASLLRTSSAQQFSVRAQCDLPQVLLAADHPRSASYDACAYRVKSDLGDRGIEFASDVHRASVDLRPLAPAIRRVLDPIMARHGRIAVSPLVLLRALIDSDPELAGRLNGLGLDSA